MNNQIVFIGKRAVADFHNLLHVLAPKKVFLFRGKESYTTCGAKEIMEKIFHIEGLDVLEWYDFQENPKIEDVEVGVRLLQEAEATVIIAVGGGSVLDMSKLVRFAYSYEGDMRGEEFRQKKALLPLFTLPTTAGTGCEATPFSVCYMDNVKYSVAHPAMLPDYAIVYPPFTYHNFPYLTACTGFDAFAQSVEAYWNVNATPVSDRYALEAIKSLWENLPKAVINEVSSETRDSLAKAAWRAGKAIAITKTTAPHAFSYAFTTHCGYPHGHAVALTFPFFFELNVYRYVGRLQKTLDQAMYAIRMKKLLLQLGLEAHAALNEMITFIEYLGLGYSGFKTHDIKGLLKKVNLQRLDNNPVLIDDSLIQELKEYLDSRTQRIS